MQLDPSLVKLCPGCCGRGVMPLAPWIRCEPCDGSGWVPNAEGRVFLAILGDAGRLLGRAAGDRP